MHDMVPCDWTPLFADCGEGGNCTHLESMDPDLSAAVQESATVWLWESTMRRYGNCPVTILPCRRRCSSYGSWPAFIPYRSGTGWVNVGCGRCGTDCSCSTVEQIVLPTPGDVLAVSEDGVSMDAWRLDNHRYLVRTDGGSWPLCQDLSYDTDPTFTVTYVPGLPLPAHGQLATGALACQMARRFCGQKCDLPANTTSVTRQGVSIVIEPGEQSGLWVVDQWVSIVNRAIPTVRSPDLGVTRTAVVTSP